MSSQYINIPDAGVPTYPSAVLFPPSASNGALAMALDTYTLYVFETGSLSWVAIATPGAAIAIDALLGDVTATGPGAVPSTVVTVGGSTAANIHSAELLANAATSASTVSTIVKRDGSGGFSAGASTFLGSLTLPAGAAATPSLVFTGALTTGLWSPGAGLLAVSVGASELARFDTHGMMIGQNTNAGNARLVVKCDGATNAGGITLTHPTSGFMANLANLTDGQVGFEMADGNLPFFIYSAATGNVAIGYSQGASPKYLLESIAASNATDPTLQTPGGTSVTPPSLTLRNTNATAGNFEGINFTGSSANVNAGIYAFNETQASTAEVSSLRLYTANAGALTEKLRIASGGDISARVGNIIINAAGKGLQIKEGSNAKMGTVSLVGGTASVSTTAVTANSRIFVSSNSTSTGHGSLWVDTIVAATSFSINSTNVLDDSVVAWMIVEPA